MVEIGIVPQDELLRDCAEQLGKIDEEARRLAGSLTEEQLHWSPPEGGWSVAEVFDHLATLNGSYVARIRGAIDGERSAARPDGAAPWKPTLFGGFLIRTMDPSSTRKVPTPKVWRPERSRPANALERFLGTQAEIAELVRAARGTDLVRTRLASPANRLIRLNLGDAFRVLVVHDWRHLGQVRRVVERAGFPRAEPPGAEV